MAGLTDGDYKERTRLSQLLEHVPDLPLYRSILYVGAKAARFHFLTFLRHHAYEIDVLEISEQRCQSLQEVIGVARVICGDVRKIGSLIARKYDVVLWSHGPSLLKREEIEPTIASLEAMADKVIILMTPHGRRRNHEHINPLDLNITPMYPCDFTRLGFEVSCIGPVDREGSNILAWKVMQPRRDPFDTYGLA